MLYSDILRHGTIAYVDTDRERLRKMVALGRLMTDHLQSPLKIEGAADHRKVLAGANFVVLSFSVDNAKYRGIDCKVSKKYGVLMCSGDTIGPGGIFRSMRELPVILQIAKDVKKLCPDAWLINYVNPTAVNGIGLMRHAPDVKTFALCDGHHNVKAYWLAELGLAPNKYSVPPEMLARFNLRIAGVNHFTWVFSATYDGKDIMPAIKKVSERSNNRCSKHTSLPSRPSSGTTARSSAARCCSIPSSTPFPTPTRSSPNSSKPSAASCCHASDGIGQSLVAG